MRKLIIFLIFLISIFIVNVIFYFLSDDYRFFLKKIKTPNEVVYLEEKKYDDNIIDKNIEYIEINNEVINIDNLEDNKLTDTSNENQREFTLKEEYKELETKNEIILWKNYTDILDLFSIYNLEKLELNTNLFDLTDEYPDNYIEYFSKDLTLYFFPTKNYTDLYDIFYLLSNDLPFSLNEVNNFWDNSFFINLDEYISDRFVRIIISNNWVVFGLKIKNTEYSLIKEKLNTLKNN